MRRGSGWSEERRAVNLHGLHVLHGLRPVVWSRRLVACFLLPAGATFSGALSPKTLTPSCGLKRESYSRLRNRRRFSSPSSCSAFRFRRTMCQDIKAKPVGFSSRTAHDHRRPLCPAKRNFVLLFSPHAPHPNPLPACAGRGRRLKMGPQTQGSAGAPPWAINISPLAGLGQNSQPF